MIEVDYQILLRSGARSPRRGMQIGRFAVRDCSGEFCNAQATGTRTLIRAGFTVDHIPSAFGIVSGVSFAHAGEIADTLSIYCPVDPDATTPAGVIEQIGAELRNWLRAMRFEYFPYREWLEKQGRCARVPAYHAHAFHEYSAQHQGAV